MDYLQKALNILKYNKQYTSRCAGYITKNGNKKVMKKEIKKHHETKII